MQIWTEMVNQPFVPNLLSNWVRAQRSTHRHELVTKFATNLVANLVTNFVTNSETQTTTILLRLIPSLLSLFDMIHRTKRSGKQKRKKRLSSRKQEKRRRSSKTCPPKHLAPVHFIELLLLTDVPLSAWSCSSVHYPTCKLWIDFDRGDSRSANYGRPMTAVKMRAVSTFLGRSLSLCFQICENAFGLVTTMHSFENGLGNVLWPSSRHRSTKRFLCLFQRFFLFFSSTTSSIILSPLSGTSNTRYPDVLLQREWWEWWKWCQWW